MLDYSIQTPRGRIAGVDFARLSAVLLAQERVLRPATWRWDLLLFLVAFAVPFAIDAARRETPARLLLALPVAWIAIAAIAVALLVALQQRTALVTPLVAALGVTGALGMQELVRLRRERQRLVAERLAAERATDLKTRFVNHVAHELRTPLSAILGFSRLLGQEGSPSNERREYAQVILRNSTHLLRLVNNLLDDARLATGHIASDPQPASVRQVVRDVVATIDGLPRERRRRGPDPGRSGGPRAAPDRRAARPPDRAQPRRQRRQVHRARPHPRRRRLAPRRARRSPSRTPGPASSPRPATASSRSSSSAVRRRRGPADPGSG